MGHLYALDFDGVLCDTCGETAISALKAAKLRWPTLFEGVDSTIQDWIVEQMITVRPVVETGYETLLLVRLLLETRVPSIRKSSVAEGLTVEDILENWLKLKPIVMEEWNENGNDLIDLFGKVRDEWLENDFTGWIGANRFYPGVTDALKFASSRVYIVTTKQSRFADALLRKLAGVTIPPERIYGLGTGQIRLMGGLNHGHATVAKTSQSQLQTDFYFTAFLFFLLLHLIDKFIFPKPNSLQSQGRSAKEASKNARTPRADTTVMILCFQSFVEDRLATLKNVIKEPELDEWNLYLVDWGFNTRKEREEAAANPRIQLLELSDFSSKLK